MMLFIARFRWTIVTVIGCAYAFIAPLAFRQPIRRRMARHTK